MKVVILSPGGRTGGGGMGTVTRLIADEFDRRGCGDRIAVLDPRGDGTVLLSPFFTCLALLRLAVLHIGEGVAALHLNVSERASLYRKGIFLLAGKAAGIPVVLHHHGAEFIPEYERRSEIYRGLVARLVRAADLNIVLGKPWAEFLEHRIGVPGSRLLLMYNAVPDPTGLAPARPRHRADAPLELLTLANLSPRKGIDDLLPVIAALLQEGWKLRLTLAGGGEVERYRRMAENLGIADRCRFTGWVSPDEVRRLLCDADIFVLPSFHEGLPMSILEAMSFGLPVVATPVGSIGEALSSGETCLLVRPGDRLALADALRALLGSPSLRATLGSAGRQAFERRFDIVSYVDRLLDVYRDLDPLVSEDA